MDVYDPLIERLRDRYTGPELHQRITKIRNKQDAHRRRLRLTARAMRSHPMNHNSPAPVPDRDGNALDDIQAALDTPGELSEEHTVFYRSILDEFARLTHQRDRYRTAWLSARRDRAKWRRLVAEWCEVGADLLRRQLNESNRPAAGGEQR